MRPPATASAYAEFPKRHIGIDARNRMASMSAVYHLSELDRFVDAMASIRGEIDQIAAGVWSVEDSPLRRAPHTAAALSGEWDRPYTRERAAFPGGMSPDKYWPPVGRVEQAYGDRNLVSSCPPPAALEG